ncbi:MAG: alginate lyase family protein [Gemmatirosa sp.]
MRGLAISLALVTTVACAGARAAAPPAAAPPAAAAAGGSPAAAAPRADAPRLIVLRAEALAETRRRIAAGDPSVMPALRRLVEDADRALRAPLVAVTDKRTHLAPTNDPHDYFSLSPYWWPDSSKADGLPYIRRDGVTNPESKRDLDQPRVAALGSNTMTLALAYHLTGNEAYARRAAEQVRRWFLDPATRMTPHLRFAQLVRGNPAERGSGIIDTRWFIETVDAVALLRGSPAWSAEDQRGMEQWCAAYATWLRTSPNGAHEQKAKNNHGSWFAAQTAALALFAGDTASVRTIVEGARTRIGAQITPAGDQPIELERTRSFHYSNFNVEALTRLAEMGRHVGVDLWRYQAPEGGSLRRAIDHLAKYAAQPAQWPGRQIDAVEPDALVHTFRRAQYAWGEAVYADVLRRLPEPVVRTDRSALLYPDAPAAR